MTLNHLLKACGVAVVVAALSGCAAYVAPVGPNCRYHPRHGSYRCHWGPVPAPAPYYPHHHHHHHYYNYQVVN